MALIRRFIEKSEITSNPLEEEGLRKHRVKSTDTSSFFGEDIKVLLSIIITNLKIFFLRQNGKRYYISWNYKKALKVLPLIGCFFVANRKLECSCGGMLNIIDIGD